MSVIRDGILALERYGQQGRPKRRKYAGRLRRGALLDVFLVVIVVLAVVSRAPVGGLAGYAIERIRGHEATLPTLTAYFDSGAARPPDLSAVALVAEAPSIPDGGVPEPYRTAARTVLRSAPKPLAKRLNTLNLPEDDRAIVALDQLYTDDVEVALEVLAIGTDLRNRAVARAAAAGDVTPSRYTSHRRYLPLSAVKDADEVVTATLALASALELQMPIQNARVTSKFGHRIHPTLKTKKFHNGVDLAAPIGTPISSAQKGTVSVVGEDKRSGKYVVIEHGNGLRTSYCHLSETKVLRGQQVSRGELVALSGNTGRSTGPHLHWTLKIAGKAMDPLRFKPQ
ncbi:MAG: peptidoglycan DD-metalloendopeptidase family protein [Rhodobacterales bacterium]|nr:peptidoglycan DD-metalloendopeptidase family protein [Rhodobacterales bacterium]